MTGDDLIGKNIGERYLVESELGKGALGVVFEAKDSYLDRKVAIKVLQERMAADTVAALRFQREAKMAASLHHPNIVTIYDFGVLEDSRPYLVMECLRGISLEQFLKENSRMTPSRAVPLFIAVCQALAQAHKNGIVHRDLKPGNIVLIKDEMGNETVKLVDFGIAKPFSDIESDLTTVGVVLGTPSYMSPEQCLGKPLDQRADIYSMGCVMYHVLTGVKPLLGETTMETLTKQVSEQPKTFAEAAPALTLPSGLEALIQRALLKSQTERQQSVIELKAELEQSLSDLWVQKSIHTRETPEDAPTIITKAVPKLPSPGAFSFFSPVPEAPKAVPAAEAISGQKMSFDMLLEKAQAGDAYSQYMLAVAYEKGDGVSPNDRQAAIWYQKSATAGCADAQFEMGSICQWGELGVREDADESLRWFKLAAEQGLPKALNSFACILEDDHPQDALKYYKAAGEAGYSMGMSNYGRCLYYGIGVEKNVDEAFRWLLKSAEMDPTNDGAQYMLGICYFNGEGVEKNLETSVKWYRKAADNGHQSAQYELGLCYLYGEGIEESVDNAIQWFRAGSARGEKRCEEKLADLTEQVAPGLTIDELDFWMRQSAINPVDVAEKQLLLVLREPPGTSMHDVINTLLPAADRGTESAQLALGRCYELGMGIGFDLSQAYHWYKTAYDRGSAFAEQHAVKCLRNCFENNIFPDGAENFLRDSANKRNTNAMISLAYYYRFQNPDGRDFSEALRFYRQAAESSDSEAQYLLGRFLVMKNLLKHERSHVIRWWENSLEKGLNAATTEELDDEGHSEERAEALKWLTSAGEEGSCDALRLLSSLYQRGLLVLADPAMSIKLLMRAAEMDDPIAQGLLGVIFIEGSGVEKREQEGVQWLQLSADAGNSFAQWNLALALIEGTGVTVNRPRAKALLERAAEGRFEQDLLWSEDGFETRFKKLIELFRDLSDRGQIDAQYWLGICYERGIGCTPERDKALELYLRAAQGGCTPAQSAFDRQPENLKKLAVKHDKSTTESSEVSINRGELTQSIRVVKESGTVMNRIKMHDQLLKSDLLLPGVTTESGSQPVTLTNARNEVGIIVFSERNLISEWDSNSEFKLRTISVRDLCAIALSKAMEAVILDPTKSMGVVLRKWEMQAFSKGVPPIARDLSWKWSQITTSSGAQMSIRVSDADEVARCAEPIRSVLEKHDVVRRGFLFTSFFEPVNEPEQLTVGIEPTATASKEEAFALNNELMELEIKSSSGLPLCVVFLTNALSIKTVSESSNLLLER